MRTVLVTGSAGFIGFHLSQLLLEEGFRVVGYDGMTDYYDVRIKKRRHQMLLQHPHFSCVEGLLEDFEKLHALALAEKPDVIVHLAAQAGVRYSLENPRAYIDANLIGTWPCRRPDGGSAGTRLGRGFFLSAVVTKANTTRGGGSGPPTILVALRHRR